MAYVENPPIGVVVPSGFPSVDEPEAGYVGGENVILDQVTMSGALVETYATRITEIADALDTTLQSALKPVGWDTVLDGVVIGDVGQLEIGNIPAPGSMVLPGFTGVIFPTCGTLSNPPAVTLDYTAPVAPEDENPTLAYTPATYTSDMWLSLFNRVQDAIDNGGSGIDPDVEAALHARDTERKRIANEKAYAVASANIASRALSFPQLAMANLDARMAGEILRQEHASSNEIVIASGDLAQKNSQFAVTTGLDIEKMLRAFHEVQEKLTLAGRQAVAEFVLKKYAERAQVFIAKWQGIAAEMRAKVDAANVVVSVNTAIIEKFKAEMQGAIGNVEMISKERESIGKLAGIEADVYKTKVEAVKAWYDALTENQKAQLQKAALELQKAEAELKFLSDNQRDITTTRKEILSTLGQIFAQVMASALNTVQTSVGHTTSRSAGISENISHGEQISEHISHTEQIGENHNVSHKGPDVI